MAKYKSYRKEVPRRPRGVVHPIWRGFGCLLIVILPLLSYVIAVEVVNYGLQAGWPLPRELFVPIRAPRLLWRVSVLVPVLSWLSQQRNLVAYLSVALLVLVFLGGIFSLLYALLYRFIGPPRYGPLDVPPPKHKPKPYKR
ncbi:MAG: hypothetical protein D6770_06460 [Anaerolineae bacterium]|nr:MAG: hypothetical protein D6770_06460 [Anaerolineae bacterium]